MPILESQDARYQSETFASYANSEQAEKVSPLFRIAKLHRIHLGLRAYVTQSVYVTLTGSRPRSSGPAGAVG